MTATFARSQSSRAPLDLSRFGAIILDMDGVLIDSHPAHRRAWQLFLHSLGHSVAEHELDFILGGQKRNDILRHFLGNLPEAELAQFGELKDEFFRHTAHEIKLLPGARQFLHRIRQYGLPLALATSASPQRTLSTLARMGVLHRFQAIVTGADVAQGKPDPAVYRLACQRLKLGAAKCGLVFEDAVSGVQAAIGAGLRCIGVASLTRAQELRNAGAEFVIRDFRELRLSFGNIGRDRRRIHQPRR